MNSESQDHFEDPGLKKAVHQAWAGERAPGALRERLLAAASHPDSGRSWRIFPRTSTFAAAALVLIAVGLGIYMLQKPAHEEYEFPASIVQAMDATHDFCAGHGDHHGATVPHSNFALIGQTMSAHLKRPVLAADLGSDWTFMGAAYCPVGKESSGHLLFKRNADFVSIFSLPVSGRENEEGAIYKTCTGPHPTAGFVKRGAMFCIVATSPSGQINSQEIERMRDRLMTIQPVAYTAPCSDQFAELTYTVPNP